MVAVGIALATCAAMSMVGVGSALSGGRTRPKSRRTTVTVTVETITFNRRKTRNSFDRGRRTVPMKPDDSTGEGKAVSFEVLPGNFGMRLSLLRALGTSRDILGSSPSLTGGAKRWARRAQCAP